MREGARGLRAESRLCPLLLRSRSVLHPRLESIGGRLWKNTAVKKTDHTQLEAIKGGDLVTAVLPTRRVQNYFRQNETPDSYFSVPPIKNLNYRFIVLAASSLTRR